MHTYEKDYRYFLQNVIPVHRLSASLRRDVTRALDSGIATTIRRESLRALDELCEQSYFVRTDVDRRDDDVIIAYKRRGGRYRVSVAVPGDEWQKSETVTAPIVAPKPVLPVVDTPIATAVELAGDDELRVPQLTDFFTDSVHVGNSAISYLPDIIQSFAVTAGEDPILSRLETLLETLLRWMDLKNIELAVLEETVQRPENIGNRVRVVTEEELRDSERLRRSIETGSRRIIPKAQLDDETPGIVDWGFLGIAPIFAVGKVQGVLQVYFDEKADESTMEGELGLTSTVVRQVIEFHHQIENLTQIDALTQVYNRQIYDMQLTVEIERAMRSGTALSLLVLDIDRFKKINDELGHKKGDEALAMIAELIRGNLRKVDMAFRYGGEEFVVLLPGTSEAESVHTAERLRRVVEEYVGFKDLHGRTRALSVSLGVAVFPDTSNNADELFVHADTAMFAAKAQGRNAVVFYNKDIEKEDDGT